MIAENNNTSHEPFRNEKGNWADLTVVTTSGIVTEDALLSYWSIFPLSPGTVPEVFAKINSAQFLLVSQVMNSLLSEWDTLVIKMAPVCLQNGALSNEGNV